MGFNTDNEDVNFCLQPSFLSRDYFKVDLPGLNYPKHSGLIHSSLMLTDMLTDLQPSDFPTSEYKGGCFWIRLYRLGQALRETNDSFANFADYADTV